jgi:hypothetical protein
MGFTQNVSETVYPLCVARIDSGVDAFTELVVTVNSGDEVEPAGTVTVVGTCAAPGFVLDR